MFSLILASDILGHDAVILDMIPHTTGMLAAERSPYSSLYFCRSRMVTRSRPGKHVLLDVGCQGHGLPVEGTSGGCGHANPRLEAENGRFSF